LFCYIDETKHMTPRGDMDLL